MKIRCITCKGIGSVAKKFPFGAIRRRGFFKLHLIDTRTGHRIGIPDIDDNDDWPQEPCLTCDSTGWIDRETADFILAVRDK